MDEHSTGLPTRGERQEQTRAALVEAARDVFSRDGYHGAGLGEIARIAGYTRGAVYSNFDGKADLFLAVMDANLREVSGRVWDPFDPVLPETDTEVAEVIRGMALATLEFIAVAARDERLSEALAGRVRRLLDLYTRIADGARPDGEPLASAEVGALLAALDQGVALLALSGLVAIDQRTMRVGLRRLVDPARAASHEPADAPGGSAALHDLAIRRQIAAARRDRDR
ncbi:TetR/AcrR family transcriptional regulator [Actinomadura algeriensis]|uniref:AcrR family transcriptional regulator n=1 Tax=Actinomadura algeriensis TaxID=1679523 RepID=A0ABR9JIP6_9ACTN|nr:TetR/AcrR family transcriptional regulator [Actinomadura algeriensis]MBE1530324.1 AcrR family transcriptional regulator [Actinomadura algeriensis]